MYIKKTFSFKSLLAFLLLIGIASLQATVWEVDKLHSEANFSLKYLLISKMKGNFKKYDFELETDKSGKLKKFEAVAKVKTIDTDNKKRDKHLQSKDFFYTKKYPEIKMKLKDYTKAKSKKKSDILTVDLTMRGITKAVEFKANWSDELVDEEDRKKVKRGLEIEGVVDRKDFEVGSNYGNARISEEIKIEFLLLLVKK